MLFTIVLLEVGLAATALAAQIPVPDSTYAPAPLTSLVVPGTQEEDRWLGSGLSREGPATMLRSPFLSESRDRNGVWFVAPRLRQMRNSHLPFPTNEGALGSAVGSDLRVSLGVAGQLAALSFLFAPDLFHQQNRDFQTVSAPEGPDRQRHELSSPFHYAPESIDLPQRFGRDSRTELRPGQISIEYDFGGLALGVGAETLWWGPTVRNALVMSSNAEAIPQVALRTVAPQRVPGGWIEGRWLVGRLEESDYFDFDESNDYRTLSALALAFSPAFEPGLSVGLARAVYSRQESTLPGFAAPIQVFRNVGRPASIPGDTLLRGAEHDQLFSFFAQWRFPTESGRAYLEWGRYEQPKNIRDLLLMPSHSQAYTFGGEWARPLRGSSILRVQGEVTYLEPSTSYRVRPVQDWYTSRALPQGYTHRGRLIGAGIGPGGSSQWLAVDALGYSWWMGLYAGRIRWENGAQYTFPAEFRFADVSLFGGVRGGVDLGYLRADVQLTSGIRYNYLFQAVPTSPLHHRGVDIRNTSLGVTLSTGGLQRRAQPR